MQPIFLKEMILHRDLLEIKSAKNPYEDDETKDENRDDLTGGNIFDDSRNGKYPVSPASTSKKI